MNPLAIFSLGEKLLDKFFPDPSERAAAHLKLMELQQAGELKELASAASVITAEAQSEHWLVSAWRPITMLCFVAIIVNNYILVPYLGLFFDTGLTLDIPPDMWQLLKIGLGGYVVGRSGEKIAKAMNK